MMINYNFINLLILSKPIFANQMRIIIMISESDQYINGHRIQTKHQLKTEFKQIFT